MWAVGKKSELNEEQSLESGFVPNFRVFDGKNYSPSSVTDNAQDIFVVYSMTSIFNANFTKESPVEYMMKETDQAFVNDKTLAPIFYLNSRELQTITQSAMFSAEELEQKDPLGKAEKSWLARFHAAEKKQHKRGAAAKRKILQWRDLLSIKQYSQIFPFFKAIICSENLDECQRKLALSFPNESIDSLLSNIESEGLFEQTRNVIDIFVSNNRKMQKTSQEAQQKLREYLAQEYAIFLTLASLDTLEGIQTAFNYTDVQMPVSISKHRPIQALLTYPISASKNKGGLAEKSFALFLTLQKLFYRHTERLNLPTLNRPLLVVDTFISEAQAKKNELLSTSSATSFAAQSHSAIPPSEEAPSIISSLGEQKSSLTCFASMYQPSSYDVTASKIIRALNSKNYINTGVDEFEVHRNGVQCTLKLLPNNNNNIKPSNEKSVSTMISNAIREVVESNELDFEIRSKFHHNGYYYQLTIALTEVKLVNTAQLLLNSTN